VLFSERISFIVKVKRLKVLNFHCQNMIIINNIEEALRESEEIITRFLWLL
jgi:hypothetical protein